MSEARPTFTNTLALLVGQEMMRARNDPDRQAAIIERLGAMLGIAIATIARGDSVKIGEMAENASLYTLERAAGTARLLAALSSQAAGEEP